MGSVDSSFDSTNDRRYRCHTFLLHGAVLDLVGPCPQTGLCVLIDWVCQITHRIFGDLFDLFLFWGGAGHFLSLTLSCEDRGHRIDWSRVEEFIGVLVGVIQPPGEFIIRTMSSTAGKPANTIHGACFEV